MSQNSIIIQEARSADFFFRRQAWHLLSLPVLIGISYALSVSSMGDDSWLGVEDSTWYWNGIALVVVQQLAVWIVFRSQLGWAILTRWFKGADIMVWGAVFIPLLIARPILLFGLAMSDRHSAGLPRFVEISLGMILLIPALYTLWSVGHFFGLERALGGDHFREKYREMSFVREGAFRWSNNAMYVFAFLGLWSMALLTGSLAALGLAFFQHSYIWVHYYCTEEPDMGLIYNR